MTPIRYVYIYIYLMEIRGVKALELEGSHGYGWIDG